MSSEEDKINHWCRDSCHHLEVCVRASVRACVRACVRVCVGTHKTNKHRSVTLTRHMTLSLVWQAGLNKPYVLSVGISFICFSCCIKWDPWSDTAWMNHHYALCSMSCYVLSWAHWNKSLATCTELYGNKVQNLESCVWKLNCTQSTSTVSLGWVWVLHYSRVLFHCAFTEAVKLSLLTFSHCAKICAGLHTILSRLLQGQRNFTCLSRGGFALLCRTCCAATAGCAGPGRDPEQQ